MSITAREIRQMQRSITILQWAVCVMGVMFGAHVAIWPFWQSPPEEMAISTHRPEDIESLRKQIEAVAQAHRRGLEEPFEVRQIRVVDEDNSVRAHFGMIDGFGPALMFYGPGGQQTRIMISVQDSEEEPASIALTEIRDTDHTVHEVISLMTPRKFGNDSLAEFNNVKAYFYYDARNRLVNKESYAP